MHDIGHVRDCRHAGHPRAEAPYALAVACLLVGTFLRLLRLGAQELRGDEAFSYLFARLPLREIIPALLAEGDPHSPLHYLLLHGIMAWLGESEWALRLPSALGGILLLVLLYRLGLAFLELREAFFMTALATASQGLVWLSQDVRHQTLLAALSATAATLMLRQAIVRPLLWRWFVYSLLSTLCLYCFYYGLFALIAHGAYVLAHKDWRRILGYWAGAMALCAMLLAPWFIAMWPGLIKAGQLADPSRPSLLQHWVEIAAWLAVGVDAPHRLAAAMSAFGCLLAAIGVIALWQRERPAAVMFGIWLVGAIVGMWAVRFWRATFNAYYAGIAAPAFGALVAAGLGALWRRSQRTAWVATGLLLAMLATNGLQLWRYYREEGAGSRSAGYRPIAAYIAEHSQQGDLFLATMPDPCWPYYLRDIPIAYEMAPSRPHLPLPEIEREMANLAPIFRRIWFVPDSSPSWDPKRGAEHWLTYHALLAEETLHEAKKLRLYYPLESAQEVLSPLNISFGKGIHLRGYHILVDGHPISPSQPLSLAPGTTLSVTWLWEANAPIPENYTVFVHLLGENGRLVAQHDGVPVWGTRPTTTWQTGERILDRHEIQVPPSPGVQRGTLLVGLYRSETIERLHLPSGADALTVLAVEFSQ